MDLIFPAFLISSLMHMTEEYLFPGGFMQMIQRLNPQFAPLLTRPAAIIINGLQLVLCLLAWVVGQNLLVFSLSVASLLLVNALVHLGASIRIRGYAPGVVTGLFVYIPLALYAYFTFINSGQLSTAELAVSFLLGILYNLVPVTYVLSGSALRGAHGGDQ